MAAPTSPADLLPSVQDVVVVHSAKGGVGKSTTAANLAVTLARLGMRVGLLDADIHGPSIAHMFGSSDPPEASGDVAPVVPLMLMAKLYATDYAEVRLPITGNELRFLDLPELPGDPPVDVELTDSIDDFSDTVWKGQIVRTSKTWKV